MQSEYFSHVFWPDPIVNDQGRQLENPASITLCLVPSGVSAEIQSREKGSFMVKPAEKHFAVKLLLYLPGGCWQYWVEEQGSLMRNIGDVLRERPREIHPALRYVRNDKDADFVYTICQGGESRYTAGTLAPEHLPVLFEVAQKLLDWLVERYKEYKRLDPPHLQNLQPVA